MSWLAERFGREPLNRPVVLPTTEFFPDSYDGSEESVGTWFECICGHMRIDPASLELEIYAEARELGPSYTLDGPGTAGHYTHDGRAIVGVELRSLADATLLVSVLAHELAHSRLLGEGHLTGEEPDGEALTDLAVVFFGLGIFPANSAVRYMQWSDGNWSGWSAARTGYVPEPLYGYALALYARARGEEDPAWAAQLRPNVRSVLRASLCYMARIDNAAPPGG